MLHGTAQGDEMILDVIDVNVLYGLDVCGDFSEAFFKTIVIPFFITVSKATVFQLLELFGDLSVQCVSESVKRQGDILDALVYFAGLLSQFILLTFKVTFDGLKAFTFSVSIFIPLCTT
ncbi:phosphomevalonate kinase, putative [Babesia ovata]|uniref:Phosphomevalonate kinase, putative n=1 Tax=Babesia ovata TaxID=189622 RepID=A0A2H6KIQ2_9APIC|nr:phosphomevalonate kinase, putative [Babesia ovata]GBE62870.1 phosphomevalonate kinase, putative [Babesia ovata]